MLKVQNLWKNRQQEVILSDISFALCPGTITAVIGPSGGGKTTLLRCLSKLEKIGSGTIEFKGQDLSCLSHGEIGLVFQAFHLFPHLTVLENLTLALLSKGKSACDVEAKAKNLLKQFDLLEKVDAYPGHLSGGQKQRIAISRALMNEPSILLFDEPTSALDPEMVKDVGNIIASLKNLDRTIILVTHEIRLAHLIADRILFLDKGKILDDLPAVEFFSGNSHLISNRAQLFLKNLA